MTFKEPMDNDKLGWIDPIDLSGGSRKNQTTFRFLGAEGGPLSIKPVKTPYDCYTLADVLGKGRGKLTLRVQINREIWDSLNDLDGVFRAFLIRNRTKLFSKQDAEYIGRDNSAVALKFKALAQRGPDSEPLYDSYITLRVNGRVGEIESLETKDGPTGKFVSNVEWAPRTTPLANTATRFSLVTAVSDKPENKGILTVSDTVPIQGPVPVGSQRMRFVGPGDIATDRNGGCVARYLLIRPLYWAIAPGGNASITLSLDSVILQNGSSGTDDKSSVMPALQAPPGFSLAPPPITMFNNRANTGGAGFFSNAAFEEASSSNLTPNMEKRRRAITGEYIPAFSTSSDPKASELELARRMDLRPQMLSMRAAGGGMSPEDVELNNRVAAQAEEQYQEMKRTSAIGPVFQTDSDE